MDMRLVEIDPSGFGWLGYLGIGIIFFSFTLRLTSSPGKGMAGISYGILRIAQLHVTMPALALAFLLAFSGIFFLYGMMLFVTEQHDANPDAFWRAPLAILGLGFDIGFLGSPLA